MSRFASYEGKRVVITGCFSGMGEATARLLLEQGAEVHGIDYQLSKLPLASFTQADLRDPTAIDKAVIGLPEKIDTLFNCAGVPSTFSPVDIFKVNYIGPRRLTDKLMPRFSPGGAIACIASTAAFNWQGDINKIKPLVECENYNDAVAWAEAQSSGIDAYTCSKSAVILWTLKSAYALAQRGLRMNCILPGPTETPFMEQQTTITPSEAVDVFTIPINRRSTPAEQAAALVFLNSDQASYINGVALPVDGGFMGGLVSGDIDLASLFALNPRGK